MDLRNWTHVTVNYIGPDEGQGINVYLNGVLDLPEANFRPFNYQPTTRNVVVGKCYNGQDATYSLDVDELMFFEEVLSQSDVEKIYSHV